MSTFHKYLKRTGQTLSSFAKRVGVTHSYLSQIGTFQRVPSLKVAVRISDLTAHEFPPQYWIHGTVDGMPEKSSYPVTGSQTDTKTETVNASS